MDKKAYWVGLNHVRGLGPKRFQFLLDAFGSPEAIWKAREESLAELLGRTAVLEELLRCRKSLDLKKELANLEHNQVQVITIEDNEYPPNLRNIYDPPPVLYVRGSLKEKDVKAIAVVGSRRATPYGKAVAERLAEELALEGFTVVSGLARGIDACGHKGALKAAGRTIAVLGCGVDVIYPREHNKLFMEIISQGAVISEFPLTTSPLPGNFPARNRIISGLSLGILVVEAAEDGGALITADFALEQGRDVFAVPGPITSRYSRGTNRLIKDGAKLVESATDILEEYQKDESQSIFQKELQQLSWNRHDKKSMGVAKDKSAVISSNNLSNEEKSLMELLSLDPVTIDFLITKSGLTPNKVNSILMNLEVEGLVQQLPGRSYICSNFYKTPVKG